MRPPVVAGRTGRRVKKIYRLREWLTTDEAAEHLSLVLGEAVSVADLLRLALDRHLVLSVNLVNKAEACLGRVVPFKDVQIHELPMPIRGGTPTEIVRIPAGMLIDDVEAITEQTRFVCFDEPVVSIDGIWDLPMRGAERLDIEHAFQGLSNGPAVELINIDGTFLVDSGGTWAALQEQLPPQEVTRADGTKKKERGAYIPAGALPADAPLVVRMSALAAFQEKLSALDAPAAIARPNVATRERDTLLKLLIGMAVEAYRHDPAATRSAAPSEIAGDLAKHGLAVTDDTVRKYLKEAAATVLPKRSGG